jgi:hypothetical protein
MNNNGNNGSVIGINSMEELSAYVGEYLRTTEDINTKKARLMEMRKMVVKETEPLMKRKDTLNKLILDFLKKIDMHGIKKDGFSVYTEKKTIPVTQETKIKTVLESNKDKDVPVENITQQLLSAMKQRPPSQDFQVVLKVQKAT